MGGGAPAVEETARGQDERAGADRCNPSGRARGPGQVRHDLGVADHPFDAAAIAAGNQQGVDRPPDVGDRAVDAEAKPAHRRDESSGRGHDLDRIRHHTARPLDAAEHLERTGNVEALPAVEGEDDHSPPTVS